MKTPRLDDAVTRPEGERLAMKFARLRASSADPTRDRHGAPSQLPDGPSIAQALGAWIHHHPRRRFPANLLLLQVWPEGLRTSELVMVANVTTTVLAKRIPLVKDQLMVPSRVLLRATALIKSNTLTHMLLAEFADPSPCARCRGYGAILRAPDETGPLTRTCPTCHGWAQGARPFKARAAQAQMRAADWKTYLQPMFNRTLHGYRYLADRAAAGVLQALG